MHSNKQPDYCHGFRKSGHYKLLSLLLIALIMVFANAVALAAQEVDPKAGAKPLDSSTFRAVSALFRYDQSIPLDARVLDRIEADSYIREKIVFTGVRGGRVPCYLAYPKSQKGRLPIILLIHAGASSKEAWWEADSFERGKLLCEKLLQLGFAILALDGQFHGERSINNDYLPVGSMVYDKKWFFRIRDGVMETVGDYFRAIDYLKSRAEVDVTRIGLAGHSMGGMIALIFAALSPNVKAAVGCVAACADSWMYPATPVNMAQGILAPTLLLAARSDEFFSIDSSERLYASLKTKDKKLEFYDGGHRLPESNVARTVEWLQQHMAR
jgi:dienelactone hydrolase